MTKTRNLSTGQSRRAAAIVASMTMAVSCPVAKMSTSTVGRAMSPFIVYLGVALSFSFDSWNVARDTAAQRQSGAACGYMMGS